MAPKTNVNRCLDRPKNVKVRSKMQEIGLFVNLFYPLMVLEYERELYQIPIRFPFDVVEKLGQLIGATKTSC